MQPDCCDGSCAMIQPPEGVSHTQFVVDATSVNGRYDPPQSTAIEPRAKIAPNSSVVTVSPLIVTWKPSGSMKFDPTATGVVVFCRSAFASALARSAMSSFQFGSIAENRTVWIVSPPGVTVVTALD